MIDIQDVDDNECFKCSIVRYLNPSDHHPSTITKADKYFAKKNYFKDIKFVANVTDTHIIEKKNSIEISVFWLWK